jgi:pimeloyl-ACP methyl ester carboxylesterase
LSESPFWFDLALQAQSERGNIEVQGVNVVYESWGDSNNPGVVLIHGSNAHLEWWRFTAPFLMDKFHVVALDLSGNGNSGWREEYQGDIFAEEVMAVAKDASMRAHPFIVGHSFGGFVALETCYRNPDSVGGLLLMDYTTAPPEEYVEWGLRAAREGVQPARKLRVYPSKEAIKERFRLIPEQPGVNPELLSHMAEYGIKEVEGGWTWKFDPSLFDFMEMGKNQRDKFASLRCHSALILGEKSEDEGAFYEKHMSEITGGLLPAVTVPGTYHHLMFDNPLAVAMTMKLLLLQWHRQDHEEELQSALRKVT